MKRFGVRAIGLGLALTAGSALAADGEWRPVGAPADPPAGVKPAGEPGLLPPALRPTPAKDGPIWLPTRAAAPAVVPAGATGHPEPSLRPTVRSQSADPTQPTSWAAEPVGPRGGENFGPLPTIPEVPNVAGPAVGTDPPAPVNPPAPLERPRPADPVRPAPAGDPMMRPPQTPPDLLPNWRGLDPQGNPLPPPRTAAPQEDAPPELQPAPAELMYPAGAFEAPKHGYGTFGSPPIRLSRDYPPLRELAGHSRDLSINDDPNGGLANRFFVRGEYLQWWLPGFATPVLATTNANTALNGYLGQPGTTSILGPGAFLDSTRSGFRVRAGAWLDDAQSCGIDGGFFFLGNRSDSAVFGSNRFPIITRPIFAPNLIPGTNQQFGETGEAVAVPGILDGTLTVQGDSQLWGADVNARWCWIKGCASRSEVFAGYRHLNLRESLTIRENITVVGPGRDRLVIPDPIGTQIVVQDRFVTRNQFHGGQIGMAYERRWGRWDLDARGSVALGATHQVLEISAFQTRQQPGGVPATFQGGLLGAGPNLGRFERNRFSVAPEFTLNVGYWLTPTVRVFGGYNFLYWSNVIRPGDQIDHTVDLTFVPNALSAGFSGQYRPRPVFKQSDLAINGIQFGLELRW